MYICKYKENLKENFACVYLREINQNIQNSKKFEHAKMSPLRYFQKDTEEIYFWKILWVTFFYKSRKWRGSRPSLFLSFFCEVPLAPLIARQALYWTNFFSWRKCLCELVHMKINIIKMRPHRSFVIVRIADLGITHWSLLNRPMVLFTLLKAKLSSSNEKQLPSIILQCLFNRAWLTNLGQLLH